MGLNCRNGTWGSDGNYTGDGQLCDQDHNRTRDQMPNCTDDCDQVALNCRNGTWSDDGKYGDGSDHPCGNYSDMYGADSYGNRSNDFKGPCGNYSDDSGGPHEGDGDGYGSMGHQDDCDHGEHDGCQHGQDSDDTTGSDKGNNGSEQLNYETTVSMAAMHEKKVGNIMAAFLFFLAQ
jgi:hypothetical protein